MIWIIASLPFWAIAALSGISAAFATMAWVVAFSKDESDDKLIKAGFAIFSLFCFSGLAAVIAAKLCS